MEDHSSIVDMEHGNIGPKPEESGETDSDVEADDEKKFIIKPKDKFFNSLK